MIETQKGQGCVGVARQPFVDDGLTTVFVCAALENCNMEEQPSCFLEN